MLLSHANISFKSKLIYTCSIQNSHNLVLSWLYHYIKSGGVEISVIQKRTFIELRDSILLSLASGQKSINQIAGETQINWKTVDNHLVHLLGKSLVREAFSSSYVRIFELTAFGKDYLRKNHGKNLRISDKKLIDVNGGVST